MQKKQTIKTPSKNSPSNLEQHFFEVSSMILEARKSAYRKVDAVLVELYWNIGEYISRKVASSEWGEGTVEKLADYLFKVVPDSRGFNRRGLYRMKQFYEAYSDNPTVTPLVTQIQWTNHLIILSRTKSLEEKVFYLQACICERYTKRELEHQISSCLYERTITDPPKLSTVLRQIHPAAETLFRDSYTLDFLGLPPNYSEYDLRKGIVSSLKQFLVEFGRDFAFVGEEYRLQVGMQDFFVCGVCDEVA